MNPQNHRSPLSPGAGVARWAQLFAGLFCFGLAVALMVRSGLGLGPWDAFHVGLNRVTGISVGGASIAVGVLIVAASWRMGIRPGIGTLANMLGIGLFIDLCLLAIPAVRHPALGLLCYAAALLLLGVGTGMYIAAGLGKGPRDGLVVGLAERTGWTVRRVRTLVEIGALAMGWAMGGPIGVGTLLFTVAVGPAMQWGLQLFRVLPARPGADTTPLPPVRPRIRTWRRAA